MLVPEGDADLASCWSLFKSGFSRGLRAAGSRSASKMAKREKGIWQRRYWEHAIRDDADLERHVDYIHHNPVKHGLFSRVGDWPHSRACSAHSRTSGNPEGCRVGSVEPAGSPLSRGRAAIKCSDSIKTCSSFHRYVERGILPADWGGDAMDMPGRFGE